MKLEPSKIAICTTTYYPNWTKPEAETDKVRQGNEDLIRGDLALKTLGLYSKQSHPVLVVDGGSPTEFREAVIRACGNAVHIHDQTEKGLGPSRHQAFREAGELPEVEVILFALAAKLDFAINGLPRAIKAFEEANADMMLVGRSSIDSLPKGQAKGERGCHRFIDTLLIRYGYLNPQDRGKWDWYSGFHIFRNTSSVQEVLARRYKFAKDSRHPLDSDVNPDHYSNALYFPLIETIDPNSPLRAATCKVPYTHPTEMREYEEANPELNAERRRIQRNSILGSLYHFLRLKEGKTSKLTPQS